MANPNSHPRFIADVMLGRLAKWLRIAGFDVIYDNRMADDLLIKIALRDGRIILTRDARMIQRRAVKSYILIESDRLPEQFRQVLRQLDIKKLPNIFGRCLICNTLLEPVAKEQVCDLVPAFVFNTQERFKVCPRCNRIYWAGTHKQRIISELDKMLS